MTGTIPKNGWSCSLKMPRCNLFSGTLQSLPAINLRPALQPRTSGTTSAQINIVAGEYGVLPMPLVDSNWGWIFKICTTYSIGFTTLLDFGAFIELDDGKMYRKPLYLKVKTMVSCRFSLKPIHWCMHFQVESRVHVQVSSLFFEESNGGQGTLLKRPGTTRRRRRRTTTTTTTTSWCGCQNDAVVFQTKPQAPQPEHGGGWPCTAAGVRRRCTVQF